MDRAAPAGAGARRPLGRAPGRARRRARRSCSPTRPAPSAGWASAPAAASSSRRRRRSAPTLAALEAPALALDPTLAKPFEKTRETVARALEAFAGKVAAAAARRDEQTARRFAALRDLVAPGGAAQERTLSSAYFPGRYGDGFGAALLDQLDLDPSRLSVVDPHR